MVPLKSIFRLYRKHSGASSHKADGLPSIQILQQDGRAFIVSLAGGDRRAIVKDVSRNTHIRSPEQLMKVQDYIFAHDEDLARSIPKITAIEQDQGWIMMEYIEATTLEEVLIACLKGGDPVPVDAGIDECAALVASLNALRPARDGLPFLPWRNDELLGKFEPVFSASPLRKYLPEEFGTLDKWCARLPADFFSRVYEQLVLVDCQPKNVLAPTAGPLQLIDLDYTVVNPALGVAHFLISLDRLGLGWPSSVRLARIRAWQRRFVATYLKHADPSFAESLVFFYPSTLIRVYALHAAERPFLAPYLRRYYGARLHRFMVRLRDIPPERYSQALPDLFAPA